MNLLRQNRDTGGAVKHKKANDYRLGLELDLPTCPLGYFAQNRCLHYRKGKQVFDGVWSCMWFRDHECLKV